MMNKKNNGIGRTCLFVCLFVAILASLCIIPTFSIGDYEVKPVNILSDVLPDKATPVKPVSPAVEPALRDTCPKGVVCIEDYDMGEGAGMRFFYDALAERQSLGRPVRIAYFGDSFIEGDILTADLREMLQGYYGGKGVGWVDIASPFTELRGTVYITSKGWTDHNVLEKEGFNAAHMGFSCRYANSSGAASITLRGSDAYKGLANFDKATLYLKSSRPMSIGLSAGGERIGTQSTNGSGQVEAVTIDKNATTARFDVGSGAIAFGVALEGKDGVVLDNLALRGSSGVPLAAIPTTHLEQLCAVRPYDLIVLQFGLNVASKKVKDYSYYKQQMKKAIANFKKAFPKTGILIVSIGDRENKVNGELCTMPGVVELIAAQQELAAEESIAFWNLFEGMGGEGSIRRMAEMQPPEAGKDYTHINRRGGKRVAEALFKTLRHGQEQHERKKTYDNDK